MSKLENLSELLKPTQISSFRKEVKSLTDVDSRDNSWSYSLSDHFAKYGFKLLGKGKYASVFGHQSYPYVVKVFMKDAAFLKWMKFSIKNVNNPYCPNFKGRIIPITKLFFALRMEKLTPYKGPINSNSQFKQYFSDLAEKGDKHAKDVLDFCTLPENIKLLDIHSDNLMMRGNQVVATDPFYNWYVSEMGKYTIDPNDFNWKI